MNIIRFLYMIIVFGTIFSCTTKRDILYMQNLDNDKSFNFKYEQYKVKVDDILKIDIGSCFRFFLLPIINA